MRTHTIPKSLKGAMQKKVSRSSLNRRGIHILDLLRLQMLEGSFFSVNVFYAQLRAPFLSAMIRSKGRIKPAYTARNSLSPCVLMDNDCSIVFGREKNI